MSQSDKDGRYPMCKDQPAQIDCRNTACAFHSNGACHLNKKQQVMSNKLTQMHEYALMITATLSGFPGKTAEELQKLPNCWLNNMADFSVDRILHDAEKRGYVSRRSYKEKNLRYWPTRKGLKEYKKYSHE